LFLAARIQKQKPLNLKAARILEATFSLIAASLELSAYQEQVVLPLMEQNIK
jgi:hypothetical protein